MSVAFNGGLPFNGMDVETEMATSIQYQMINYARNSVNVEINCLLPDVSITNRRNFDSNWYMQEEEAQAFLDKAENFWSHFDLTAEQAVLLAAYEYADAL